MIKGVLLDIDGTLVVSNDAHASAWEETFAHFGYDISFAKVRPLIGMGGDLMLPKLIPGITREKQQELAGYRSGLFLKKYAPNLKPTRGARELVEYLQAKKIKLIIASSANNQELSALLKAADVQDLLHEFTTASDVETSKPAPDIIAAALQKLKVSPDEALMVGDSPYDVASANKCGVVMIALRSGGFSDELLKGAFRIFDNPKELQTNFDSLTKEIFPRTFAQ